MEESDKGVDPTAKGLIFFPSFAPSFPSTLPPSLSSNSFLFLTWENIFTGISKGNKTFYLSAMNCTQESDRNKNIGASLVAQWLRIRLPMQGTWVRALVPEDPTCRRAAKPVGHNFWSCALEPESHNHWARAPQLLQPACLDPLLRNKRSHHSEKHAQHNEE